MPLRRVGFFRELRHGLPNGPSLAESRQNAADPDEQNMLHYLAHGTTLAATGSSVDDVLDPAKKAVATLAIVTDGTWLWPTDLPYYIAHYHVRLPPDFIEHMRMNTWRLAKLDRASLIALEAELRKS